ncbi:MAG: hypothetical protein V7693_16220 [Halopseudomonas sabulinigri]
MSSEHKIEVNKPTIENVRPADGLVEKPGIASRVTGFYLLTRNMKDIKRRSSFPLLRKIIRDEALLQRTTIPCADIRSELLRKTSRGHQLFLVLFSVISLWSVLLLVKGGYAAIAHGHWFNDSLMFGLPLLALGVARTFTSYRTICLCDEELLKRGPSHGYMKEQS